MTGKIERWRPVLGLVGLYEVSDRGNVRSLRFRNRFCDRPRAQPKLLVPDKSKKGYLRFEFAGRKHPAARLVLDAFVGPAPRKEADHVNGVRDDNRLGNLVWATRTENEARKRGHRSHLNGARVGNSKLTEHKVREARRLYARGCVTFKDLGERYGVRETTVAAAIHGRSWAHVSEGS